MRDRRLCGASGALLAPLVLAAAVCLPRPHALAAPAVATAVTAGDIHSCALMITGGVKCWGQNGYGQVGDGTSRNRLRPVDVQGLTGGVTQISALFWHTCAVTDAGGAKCWGDNEWGQLGDGSTTNSPVPVDVSGLSSGVAAVSAGGYQTCAVTDAGGAKCWGQNAFGQLGDGTTTIRTTPVSVSGLSSGVVQVSAGYFHTCALTDAGAVKCWGDNASGQVGDGSTRKRTSPVSVSGLSSGVVQVSAGYFHTCALTDAGGVECWGRGEYGELGNGSTTDSSTPVAVQGLSSGVAAISAGENHTCALMDSGGLKCWGENAYGQLGNGGTVDSATPVNVTGLSSGVAMISAGGIHACALMNTNGVRCWGDNTHGELGNGTRISSRTSVHVVFPGPDALIKRPFAPGYLGDGVFSPTGASQTSSAEASPGAAVSFSIEVQNEGTSDDSFLLSGCGDSPVAVVRYWVGGANVTSQVVAGTYPTATLAPSAQASLTAKVTVRSTAEVGQVRSCLLTATTRSTPVKQDAVGFKVTLT